MRIALHVPLRVTLTTLLHKTDIIIHVDAALAMQMTPPILRHQPFGYSLLPDGHTQKIRLQSNWLAGTVASIAHAQSLLSASQRWTPPAMLTCRRPISARGNPQVLEASWSATTDGNAQLHAVCIGFPGFDRALFELCVYRSCPRHPQENRSSFDHRPRLSRALWGWQRVLWLGRHCQYYLHLDPTCTRLVAAVSL